MCSLLVHLAIATVVSGLNPWRPGLWKRLVKRHGFERWHPVEMAVIQRWKISAATDDHAVGCDARRV
jgi:hypothetical protein